jgi:hypothetical protein
LIGDGANSGKTTTADGNGFFSFTGLTPSNANVAASASGYDQVVTGLFIDGSKTISFVLKTTVPWTMSGKGNTVFDMPTYITRVRIQGTWDRTSNSNFIVSIGGRNVLNEILRDSITYDGISLTTGGVVSITSSGQISWTFTEVR